MKRARQDRVWGPNTLGTFIVIAFVLVVASEAATDPYPLTKVPMLTYLVDYEASWSPNGGEIVLISNRHGGMKVHILNAASENRGSDMRQVTTGPDEDDSPAWSPDGRQIAFVSIHEGASHIFVMNVDGAGIRQLTSGSGNDIHPAWSPDGSRILFNTTHFAGAVAKDEAGATRVIGEKADDSMDLATVRPDGSDFRRLTVNCGCTYASFSPDGRSIVHRRQRGNISQVYVMNADGTDDRNLSGSAASDGWPAWSSDGKRIVFSRNVENGFQIFVMNRDGSSAKQLTNASGEFTNPRWSPDGSKILCGRRWGGVSLALFDAPR